MANKKAEEKENKEEIVEQDKEIIVDNISKVEETNKEKQEIKESIDIGIDVSDFPILNDDINFKVLNKTITENCISVQRVCNVHSGCILSTNTFYLSDSKIVSSSEALEYVPYMSINIQTRRLEPTI